MELSPEMLAVAKRVKKKYAKKFPYLEDEIESETYFHLWRGLHVAQNKNYETLNLMGFLHVYISRRVIEFIRHRQFLKIEQGYDLESIAAPEPDDFVDGLFEELNKAAVDVYCGMTILTKRLEGKTFEEIGVDVGHSSSWVKVRYQEVCRTFMSNLTKSSAQESPKSVSTT